MKRVLKPTGSMFINLGDKYSQRTQMRRSSHQPGMFPGKFEEFGESWAERSAKGETRMPHQNTVGDGYIPEKSLMGLPWRFALGCIDNLGLILRAEIILDKKNGLPECLDPSTRVFIRQNGWVSRVELDALVGMESLPEILGPDGWVQVRRVWETQKPAIYFAASKVEHVICSPEHLFPVSSERRNNRYREVPAAEIRHEGYADYLLYSPIGRFLNEPQIESFVGWPLDETTGYLVGVYAAEGGIQGLHGTGTKLTIGTHEHDFADRIRYAFKTLGVSWREAEDRNARTFSVNHDRFLRLVTGFVAGLVKRKVLNIDLLLNAPESFRQGVLDGYIEGDGSDRTQGGWIATSASKQLRDDISTLASSLGIITSKKQTTQHDKRTDKTYTSWQLWTPYITRRKTKTGMDGIYQVPPRSRKEAKGGIRRMIDLEVDGGLFLIGDGLVTHNSVQDRVRRSHEQVFHFVKSPRYFAAVDEIRENYSDTEGARWWREKYDATKQRSPGNQSTITKPAGYENPLGKLPGSVWPYVGEPLLIPPAAKERYNLPDHFAAFSTELPRRIILGWSPSGVCVVCGEPRRPVVDKQKDIDHEFTRTTGGRRDHREPDSNTRGINAAASVSYRDVATITGYACACPDDSAETKPSLVLDPFMGTGTVLMVARMLGRNSVGVDLSADYCRLARWRIQHSGHGNKALRRTWAEKQGNLL